MVTLTLKKLLLSHIFAKPPFSHFMVYKLTIGNFTVSKIDLKHYFDMLKNVTCRTL